MRRFIGSKLAIVALVFAVITLITGVTWAANSSTSSSSPNNQLTGLTAEVVASPLTVEVGGKLDIAGAGFSPEDQVVLFELVLGGGSANLILKSGTPNSSGAFLSRNPRLSEAAQPGIYTIKATTARGLVATTPLIVIEVVK